MFVQLLFVHGNHHFLHRIEGSSFSFDKMIWCCSATFCNIIKTKNHVLRRYCNWCTIRRIQNVVRGKHQKRCFQNCFMTKWYVNRHLVTVKVSVECSTNEWVKLNRFTFNQFWLECLNTQTVKSRSTIQKNRVSFQYIFKDIPNNRIFTIYDFLGRLNCFYNSSFNEFPDNKRLEKLSRHFLWKTTLVKFQFRTYDDNRTTGVVNPFTQQVLAETSLLSFQHIRK